jgi:hypothetical protein
MPRKQQPTTPRPLRGVWIAQYQIDDCPVAIAVDSHRRVVGEIVLHPPLREGDVKDTLTQLLDAVDPVGHERTLDAKQTRATIRVRVWTDVEGYTAAEVEADGVGGEAGIIGRPFSVSVRSVADVAALGHALIRAAAPAKGAAPEITLDEWLAADRAGTAPKGLDGGMSRVRARQKPKDDPGAGQ